ncbi:MAG: hypothetical protein ACI85F_001538 [Bacteroidia bacterium]
MKNELSSEQLELETNPRQPHHLLRVMEKKIAYAIIAGLWVYVALRSVFVPITIDEAATFFHYIQPQKWLPGDAHWDANNHILNSGLSIISYRLFGADEWALRLPNLFAGLLYLIMAWKLAQRINDRVFRWSMFLALGFCSFLLEYFGYTRGYGLSIGFLALGLWSFLQWRESGRLLYLISTILGILLMVIANLSLLVSGLIMTTLVFAFLIIDKRKNPVQYAVVGTLSALGFYFAISHSLNMKERGLLYYGEGDSFWHVTVRTLGQFTYHPIGDILIWILPAAFLVVSILVVITLKKSSLTALLRHKAVVPVALLFGNLFANFSMHFLMGVNYPEDRVALGYLPFIIISAMYLADGFESKSLKFILVPFALSFPIQLLATANVSMCPLWDRDQYLPNLLEVAAERFEQTGIEPTVEGYMWRRLAYDYHNWDTEGRVSSMRAYSKERYVADLVITENAAGLDLSTYTELLHDPWSPLIVYERTTPWQRTLIKEGVFETRGQTDAQFKEFVNITLPANKPSGYLFVPEITFESESIPPRISMVGQVSDPQHSGIDFHEVALDRVRSQWKDESAALYHSVLLDAQADSAAHLKVFLWNRENQGSYSATGSWKLYELR